MLALFNSWLAKNPETLTIDSSWAGKMWLQHTTECRFPTVKTFLSHNASIFCFSPGGKTLDELIKARFGFEYLLVDPGCHACMASGIEDKC